MINKRIALVLFTLCLMSVPAHAQTGDSLVIHFKNGDSAIIPLSQIQKITFDSATVAVHDKEQAHGLEVSPNYPNPLLTETTIDFEIATAGIVKVVIYDSKGNAIREIKSQCQAGRNQIIWDGLDVTGIKVPSGSYFYEVRFKDEAQVRQIVVIK